jgi:hypothetical protein
MNSDEMMYAARCEYLDKVVETARTVLEEGDIEENEVEDFLRWNFKLSEEEIELILSAVY